MAVIGRGRITHGWLPFFLQAGGRVRECAARGSSVLFQYFWWWQGPFKYNEGGYHQPISSSTNPCIDMTHLLYKH